MRKVPDFQAMHAKATERQESIYEFQKRMKERHTSMVDPIRNRPALHELTATVEKNKGKDSSKNQQQRPQMDKSAANTPTIGTSCAITVGGREVCTFLLQGLVADLVAVSIYMVVYWLHTRLAIIVLMSA